MKYLRINLTKYAKDLYIENYKILLREIKGYVRKCRHILWHGQAD